MNLNALLRKPKGNTTVNIELIHLLYLILCLTSPRLWPREEWKHHQQQHQSHHIQMHLYPKLNCFVCFPVYPNSVSFTSVLWKRPSSCLSSHRCSEFCNMHTIAYNQNQSIFKCLAPSLFNSTGTLTAVGNVWYVSRTIFLYVCLSVCSSLLYEHSQMTTTSTTTNYCGNWLISKKSSKYSKKHNYSSGTYFKKHQLVIGGFMRGNVEETSISKHEPNNVKENVWKTPAVVGASPCVVRHFIKLVRTWKMMVS